jgi:transposase
LKKKEEELKAIKEQSSQVEVDSSSTEDGDEDLYYRVSKVNKKDDKKKCNDNKYGVVSFHYPSMSNHDRRPFINVPTNKLPHFDRTNFAKWKHLMKAYLVGLHPGIWEIVHDGVEPLVDPKNPTPTEMCNINLNGQAISVFLSALDGDEYNRVMGVEVAKQIWDTLHVAHEWVDKVRKARIDLLMAKLNRFMILDGEGPQEIFDRLMVIVGKIRGYGGDELDDHKVVKIILEAYSPRNETVVTLIRDKKKFEHFTPNDVLGRIMTFDMQREEALERRKLGELQAKLDGMKNKDVALKANKSTKQASTSKSKFNKQASTSKPKAPKQVQEQIETTSSSSEDESDHEQYEEVGDVALFMKRVQKGLNKHGYKFVKRRFPNKKKRTCYNCGSTEHFIAECPHEIKKDRFNKSKKESKTDYKKSKRHMGEAHIGHEWDSTRDSSSEEDKKVATIAIHKPSSTPKLFNNMSDNDYYSPHVCLMAKGEKVKMKSKPKPSPPSDISSSDSNYSSDEEIDNITKNLDSKTKLFITKLMEELESTQAKLASREKTLIKQDDLYIASKEALALERSEVESLCKALAKEQEAHAITKKANIDLKQKY